MKPGNKTVCSGFIVLSDKENLGDHGKLVFGDCGVIIEPTAEQLADIAVSCAERAKTTLEIAEPKVAMLCYSTKGSGSGEEVDKVKEAVEILKSRNVDFAFDGELQADAALVPEVGERKAPGSKVAGHANVLISRTCALPTLATNWLNGSAAPPALGLWYRAWPNRFWT